MRKPPEDGRREGGEPFDEEIPDPAEIVEDQGAAEIEVDPLVPVRRDRDRRPEIGGSPVDELEQATPLLGGEELVEHHEADRLFSVSVPRRSSGRFVIGDDRRVDQALSEGGFGRRRVDRDLLVFADRHTKLTASRGLREDDRAGPQGSVSSGRRWVDDDRDDIGRGGFPGEFQVATRAIRRSTVTLTLGEPIGD